MSIISYAQNFEDVMLWRALGHIEQGFYIDVGAQDPTIDSVSLAFHEHGWRGIHVEPTPHYAEMLRKQRPGDTVIQAAIGTGPALSRFFEIPDTGISTADFSIAEQHRARGFTVNEITVTVVSLESVFEQCSGEIHWLKIDVEGLEHQVLSSWGASTTRPWIVVVESTLPLTQIENHDCWEATILSYGYSLVYFDGLNRYYVSCEHSELKVAFATPPNVFDGFTLNGTASAPFHRLIEERYRNQMSAALTQSELQIISLQNQAQQTLTERNREAEQELEALHHVQAQKELEVATQLLAIQQKSEQERVEQSRLHNEQADALRREYAERENSLSQQRQADEMENLRLEQERLTREKTLHEHANQAKQERENFLRTQVQREQDVAAQLLAAHQLAEREKAELVRSHSEQERAMHTQHIVQAKEHAEQIRQAHAELDTLLRQQILREQQAADQLLAVQREAVNERAELTKSHSEQERKLHLVYGEREGKLQQQLHVKQEDLQNLHKDRARREQEMGEKLLALQLRAAKEMAEQVQKHSEQASALIRLHTERENFLIQDIQAGQREIRGLEIGQAQREKDHAEHIHQSRQELANLLRIQTQREQENSAQLLTLQQQAQQEKDEHTRLLAASAALEAQLKANVLLEQESSLRLRQSLADVQKNLSATHGALTWRMTSPLRRFASMIAPERDSAFSSSPIGAAKIPTETPAKHAQPAPVAIHMPAGRDAAHASPTAPVMETGVASLASIPPVSESPLINAQNASLEAIMPSSAQVTQPSTPTQVPASTLDELLAHHDQNFVHCAYKTLLGRSPDTAGHDYYLSRLRTGFSKIQILAQLRLSKEGDIYGANLPTLDTAIQRYKETRYPLIGWIFKIINGVEGDNPAERKLRVIENQIHLLNNESRNRFDLLENQLFNLHHLISQSQPVTADSTHHSEHIVSQVPAVQDEESDNARRLLPRPKAIYLQLKSAAAVLAKRKS